MPRARFLGVCRGPELCLYWMCLPQPRGLRQCLCAGLAPCALAPGGPVRAARFSERAAASAAPQAPCCQAPRPAPALASLCCTYSTRHRAPRCQSSRQAQTQGHVGSLYVGLIRGLPVCPLGLPHLKRGSLRGRGTADLLPFPQTFLPVDKVLLPPPLGWPLAPAQGDCPGVPRRGVGTLTSHFHAVAGARLGEVPPTPSGAGWPWGGVLALCAAESSRRGP